AVLDCNDDGFPDLVIGDRANQNAQLFLNVPDPMRPGNRTFVDATAGSGLDDADGQARISRGVIAADYDNDGHADVFMAGKLAGDGSFGLLYRGNGDGTFANVSTSSGVRVTTDCNADSASWTDYDLDGDLDLLVGCAGTGVNFELIENDGDGTFTVASDRLPPPTSASNVYSLTWLDVNEDGYDDCLTLASPGETVLLLNSPGPQDGRIFVNAAATYGYTNLGPAPMGIAAGDYDGDGDLDVAVSNGAQGSYYNFDAGLFTAVPLVSSIWGWGVTWLDVENDGDLDLYMCGSLGQGPNFDKLFRNNGLEGFDDISAALNGIFAASRYAVQIDFNNDGRQDIVTCNTGSPEVSLSVYENLTTVPHHWVTLRLVGDGAAVNLDAVGTVVRLDAGGAVHTRHLASGTSTSATEDTRLAFGLGAAATVDRIEIVWPRAGSLASRTEVFCGPFATDQIITLVPSGLTMPGDVDGDGIVNVVDFLALLEAWGACPASWDGCSADFDGDCSVGVTDFLVQLANWG
ncbi:MAG: FG-GAP-like repeat-containing protein, partial [Planctomycetota bacterium]